MTRDVHGAGTVLAVAGITAMLLTGCTNASTPDGGTGTAPAVAATPTTSEPSAQEVAVESATTAVRDYYAVADGLLNDPQTPIDRAVSVAGGAELDELRSRVQAQRVRGERTAGAVVIKSTTASAANLSDPTTVELDVCLDVSGVDVVDANGTSLLTADRPTRTAVTATVVDRGDRGWLVEQTAASGAPC